MCSFFLKGTQLRTGKLISGYEHWYIDFRKYMPEPFDFEWKKQSVTIIIQKKKEKSIVKKA